MKNLIISLVAASVLFVIGCQENSITDPAANEPSNKVQSEIPAVYLSGVIPLNSALKDPYPLGNSYYKIYGQIEYDLRIINDNNGDPKVQFSKRYASVYFTTDASLSYFCTVCSPSYEDELAGFISDVSEEYVALGGNYVSLLEKTFSIQGRTDGMVLKVKFNVSADRVEINSMWLALPPQGNQIINHF
jgi:hypothetical protein